MLIKAPVSSMEMVKAVISAGADEIYVGLPSPGMVNITLSGRGAKTNADRNCQLSDLEELKRVVDYAKNKGKRVDYTVNNPFIVSDKAEELLISQIKMGLDAGVDAMIVADLYTAKLVKEYAPSVKLCASSFFDIYNSAQIEYLRSLGIERVILAYDLMEEDFKLLNNKKKDMEFEVFGQFGCSLKIGPCLLLHGSGENIDVGLPCRNLYRIGGSDIEMPLLDSGRDCAVCYMKKLIEMNIDVMKIIGREKSISFIASIVAIYRKVIDELNAGYETAEIRKEILIMAPWWDKVFCSYSRCKYKRTKDTTFMIV